MIDASATSASDRANISYALRDLLALEQLFARASGASGAAATSGARRRAGLRLVRRLGNTSIRVLLRELLHGEGQSPPLALHLLARLDSPRVTADAARLLRDPGIADAAKLRLLELLSERGEPIPDDASLADPTAVLGRAIEQLLGCLSRPEEFDRAARLLLGEVPDDELVEFCRAGLQHAGARAVPLVEAMLRCGAMGFAAHEALRMLLAASGAAPAGRSRRE